VLRYMEWDCALYRALLERALPAAQAGRLIEDINWDVFGPAIALGFTASRLRSAAPATRVGWLLEAMFALLFTRPFARRPVSPGNRLEFDVTACPLAAHMRRLGTPELTRYAACALDHRMARAWGVRLDRTRTIAEGAALCDFRFRVGATPPSARSLDGGA
jgi:hypothetical protein